MTILKRYILFCLDDIDACLFGVICAGGEKKSLFASTHLLHFRLIQPLKFSVLIISLLSVISARGSVLQ